MPKNLTILSTIFLALAIQFSHAQNFPVRVTPILTPPYTPFLTDYTDAGSEKLTVQILLNDVTVPEYRCKLRLSIEGVNISITTNPNYVPLPIVLSGGVPQIVYGSDLSEYFKSSNLVFQGINQNEFEKKGSQLPEGIYRISIEVLDYNRGTVVSNKGSATAWMILNDPPFINMPVNNSKLRPLNPQNIVFQWTPRHRGSPNAAFTTEYEVKLVEIWPQGRNPYDAINTSRPIFETTVDNTLVVYGPAETPLVLGREYALQVRARDTGGKDLFKNNGYSEVIRFVYGDECPLPSGLFADDLGTVKARMRWQGNGQNSGYILRYREKKEGAQWFPEQTSQTLVNVTQLKAGATYEYQVCGECEGYRSEYTAPQTFNTLAVSPDAFVCGSPGAVPPIDGSAPLQILLTNDFINAGGFDVVVTKATGSNGRFSGEGLAVIPWFNSAKVRMTFNNISVNKSYQLTSGDMVSVWNPNSKMLIEKEKTLAEGGGKGLDGLATVEADTLIQLTGSIITVFINTDGNIVAQTNQGDVVIPKEKGKSYAIADQLGNGYLVDKDGKITKTTATDVANAAARGQREYSKDPNLSVRFAKAEGTNYGFDEQREGTLQENYQQTEAGKWIAWKALPSGSTDVVAVAPEGTTDLSKVKFKVEGIAPKSLPIAIGTQVLSLTGSTHGTTEELLAYYPQQDTSKDDVVVGKLNIVSYDEVKKNLVIVEVNNATYPGNINALTNELNKTYAQGVAGWTSVTKQSMTVTGLGEKFDDGESGLLSNYTPDMKTVLNAFTKNNTLATNTYYLFLIKAANDPGKLGYMPRKKQAGFIFLGAHSGNEALLINTIAHELGHGAFRLKHTFSEYSSLEQGATDNLMDYNRGMRLNKYQWDFIHNPEAVLGLFEGDEEGAMSTFFNKDLVSELLREINKSNDDSDKKLSINVFSPQSIFTLTHSASFSDFSVEGLSLKYLKVTITRTSDVIDEFLINPAQISKVTIPGNNGDTYLKYKFLPLNKDNDSYIPNSLISENAILEIEINREDEFAFETYLFNVMRPLPGNPLLEMSVVHTYTAPTSGGMFGCARLDPITNCTSTTIPNLPTYTGMNKVHDGIDVYAVLDTDVFAMYEGTVQFVENTVPANTKGNAGDFGNRIRISSTPEQHRISNKNFVIYTYYTHLNEVGSNITVGALMRQGELLGKTGKTGNAINIPIERHHTHICVYQNGTELSDRIDPRPYFNTQFDLNGNVTN